MEKEQRLAAILLAGGIGTRMGDPKKHKQYQWNKTKNAPNTIDYS